MPLSREQRLRNARTSLEGLSVGDAFGESYFGVSGDPDALIAARTLRPTPWSWTDDTLMALSIYNVLQDTGEINQEALAADFSRRYDVSRGYGPNMHGLLDRFRRGVPWRVAAPALFGGQGSWGNGAAMRVAPLGAYFADDLTHAAEQAARSAEVTHTHSEAIAGAIAVAVAAALAYQYRDHDTPPDRVLFLKDVYRQTPNSRVSEGLRRACDLDPNASVFLAVAALGNGTGIAAHDTVPFALWCAAGHLKDYEAALWQTVSGFGDRDTTCAIVGGIVACCTGTDAIPVTWRTAREPLPAGADS